MTERRTGARHRGDARGLAQRRPDSVAARPLQRTERADLVVRRRVRPGRQPGVVPDRLGGRPPDRLVDALFAWLTPDRQLAPDLNRFQVLVSDDGDTRIERYGD